MAKSPRPSDTVNATNSIWSRSISRDRSCHIAPQSRQRPPIVFLAKWSAAGGRTVGDATRAFGWWARACVVPPAFVPMLIAAPQDAGRRPPPPARSTSLGDWLQYASAPPKTPPPVQRWCDDRPRRWFA
jgi:hypothetical protein